MIRVDKDTGSIKWKYQTVPFTLDGDPDWAAGATVMSTSCGELIASVQKDGWSYAIDASGPFNLQPLQEPHPQCSPHLLPAEPGLSAPSWQFPPTTKGCRFTDPNQKHGDDDYRRPGAAWNDVFIVRTGGENWSPPVLAATTEAACAQCLRHERTRPSPLDRGDPE